MKRKIAAILASDIAGYSRLVAEDEEDTLARFGGYRRAFEDFVTQHGGRVFNTAGDAILAEFPSAVEATRCAIEIQETMRTRNMGYAPSRQMLFRIGLTIGDVVERDGDLLGDGVNIAARLEALAEPGGICVSRSIYEQVANKLSVPFQDIGQREVKNIPQPIHAFRVNIRGLNVGPDNAHPDFVPQPVGFTSQPRREGVSDRRVSGGLGAGVILGALALATGATALGVVLWRDGKSSDPGPNAQIQSPKYPPISELPIEYQPRNTPPRQTAGVAPENPPLENRPPTKPPQEKPPQEKPAEAPPVAAETKPVAPTPDPGTSQVAARKPGAEEQAERRAGLPAPEQPSPQEAPPQAAPRPGPTETPRVATLGPVEPPQTAPSQPEPPPVAPLPPRPAIPPGASPADAFAFLSKAGGIIPGAQTAPELYHNARTFEARGEAANARTEYLKLAELGGDHIDPHLRFAALLRAQDGRAGARELYARLAEGKGGRVAALVHALQFEGPDRRARIAALAGQHAPYGPVHMLLADEYASERIGGETIGERRAQFAALQQFLEADRQGSLSQHFMDHSVLAQWLDRARSRHNALEQFFKTAKLEPTAQFMHVNTGWMAHVWVPEPATRIAWRTGANSEFRPTGDSLTIDQRTGKPAPNLSFELPRDMGAAAIEIRYEDANGELRGPFTLTFEPRTELVKSQRELLERFSNNWIAFGEGGVQANLVYFTHLVTYRCAISKVVMVFDDSSLPMQLRLPPCDPLEPLKLPANFRPFMNMPGSAKSVTVEIAFADGTTSEKRKFDRK